MYDEGEHLSKEYLDGHKAFYDRKAITDNPYEDDPSKHYDWDEGYSDARDDFYETKRTR